MHERCGVLGCARCAAPAALRHATREHREQPRAQSVRRPVAARGPHALSQRDPSAGHESDTDTLCTASTTVLAEEEVRRVGGAWLVVYGRAPIANPTRSHGVHAGHQGGAKPGQGSGRGDGTVGASLAASLAATLAVLEKVWPPAPQRRSAGLGQPAQPLGMHSGCTLRPRFSRGVARRARGRALAPPNWPASQRQPAFVCCSAPVCCSSRCMPSLCLGAAQVSCRGPCRAAWACRHADQTAFNFRPIFVQRQRVMGYISPPTPFPSLSSGARAPPEPTAAATGDQPTATATPRARF